MARVSITIILSLVALLNLDNNKIIVEKSNIDMYYRRYTLEQALKKDILRDVPKNAAIIVKDEFNYDPFPSKAVSLKSWAYTYDWKNKYLFYHLTNKKLAIFTNVEQIVNSKGVIDIKAGGKIINFNANSTFLLKISSCNYYESNLKRKEGYVTLATVKGIRINDKDINSSDIETTPLEQYYPDSFAYSINKAIDFKDGCKLAAGWSYLEPGHRWTEGVEALVKFSLDKKNLVPNGQHSLFLTAGSNGRQPVTILINENSIGTLEFNGQKKTEKINFNSDILFTDRINTIKIKIPDARLPGNGDPRELGIYLGTLVIKGNE